MRTLLRTLGIVAATFVFTIVTLAAIGFSRGPRTQTAGAAALPPSVPAQPKSAPTAPQMSTPPPSPVSAAPKVSSPSALITTLNELEAQGKHADAALLVFDKAPILNSADRADLISWLKDRVNAGRIPALYLLARVHFHSNDIPKAARLYAAAGLCGRIDAARLTDSSAAGAVPGMEAHFTDLKRAIAADAKLRREASAWALDFEEFAKDRAAAAWIAAHGMAAFSPGPTALLSDDQWQAKRQAFRESWKKAAAE